MFVKEIAPQEQNQAPLSNNARMDLYEMPKAERYEFYDFLAKLKCTIRLGGPPGQGMFAALIDVYPRLRMEIEEKWYTHHRHGEAGLRLCKSRHHGIINPDTTRFKALMRTSRGGDTAPWKITNMLDSWYDQLPGPSDHQLARSHARVHDGAVPLERVNSDPKFWIEASQAERGESHSVATLQKINEKNTSGLEAVKVSGAREDKASFGVSFPKPSQTIPKIVNLGKTPNQPSTLYDDKMALNIDTRKPPFTDSEIIDSDPVPWRTGSSKRPKLPVPIPALQIYTVRIPNPDLQNIGHSHTRGFRGSSFKHSSEHTEEIDYWYRLLGLEEIDSMEVDTMANKKYTLDHSSDGPSSMSVLNSTTAPLQLTGASNSTLAMPGNNGQSPLCVVPTIEQCYRGLPHSSLTNVFERAPINVARDPTGHPINPETGARLRRRPEFHSRLAHELKVRVMDNHRFSNELKAHLEILYAAYYKESCDWILEGRRNARVNAKQLAEMIMSWDLPAPANGAHPELYELVDPFFYEGRHVSRFR